MKVLKNKLKLEDEEIQEMIFSVIDILRDMGHRIKDPQDEELEKIWNQIEQENYEDEHDLRNDIVNLIFEHLYIKAFDINELKGQAMINAINNMIEQLLSDDNEIDSINDITLDRIYAEIDSLELKFDENGSIVL